MHRRAVLGTLAVGCGIPFAGCVESSIDGEVIDNGVRPGARQAGYM
jgi:hypothetical protein